MALQSVENFASQLRRLQVAGSNETALETAQLLRTVISNSRWANAAALIATIRELGVRLVRAQPVEFAVGNVVRRVLHLIREEYRASMADAGLSVGLVQGAASGGLLGVPGTASGRPGDASSPDSADGSTVHRPGADSALFNMLLQPSAAPATDYTRTCFPLKQLVIQGVNEIIEELETVSSTLAHQAHEYIQSDEVVMTIGRSGAVERFLLAAARKRRFTVVVAEGSPGHAGHSLARTLASAGVDTLLIADAAIPALMSRVNHVFVGCHAVTANGGIIGPSGMLLLAEAARMHGTPLCVVTGLYKLTPIFPEHGDAYTLLASPAAVLPYADGALMSAADVVNPLFDYVPPPYVALFVTNTGGHPPSYVYRLMREMYDMEDYSLS